MWPFQSKAKKTRYAREQEQIRKIAESQSALITAATATADAAHHVTTRLKQHLEDAVRQLEATAALISDALLICDENGYIRAVNPAAEIVFAASSGEIINRSILGHFLVDGAPPLSCTDLWTSIERGDDGRGVRLVGFRHSGETFPLDITMTRLDKSDGSTVILVLVRDVSRQSAMQRATESRERHFRTLFELSFDGILIVQDGRIVAANPAAGRLFGREPRGLLAMSLSALLDDPSDSAEIISGVEEQAEARRSDGTPVTLLFRTGTIQWNDTAAHLITVKEVAGRKSPEAVLDLICVFGPDLRITFANEGFASYYGIARDVLIGSDIRDLIPECERDAFLLNTTALTPANPTRRITVHTTVRGEQRMQDWIDHASFDATGKVIEYERTGRDITNTVRR